MYNAYVYKYIYTHTCIVQRTMYSNIANRYESETFTDDMIYIQYIRFFIFESISILQPTTSQKTITEVLLPIGTREH